MPRLSKREQRLGLDLPVSVAGQDVSGVSFTEATRSLNVSGGGICFESHHRIQPGSRLTLQVQLPPGLRRHFGGASVYKARAVVCRVEGREGHPTSRIGARFLGPPADD